MKRIRNTYLSDRFFFIMAILTAVMMLSFGLPVLYPIAIIGISVFSLVTVAEFIILNSPSIALSGNRKSSKLLSLGSNNRIQITLFNHSPIALYLKLIDEQPEQLQNREFMVQLMIKSKEKQALSYIVLPTIRGLYHFGNIILLARTPIGLVERRMVVKAQEKIAVYPSIINMKNMEMKVMASISNQYGIKKLRRLGHSYEFEQIKQYVQGDDYRNINWKVTGRRGGQLMVNQYEDEKSQQIYAVIDKSRSMKLPFGGLSLLDHSINSALVIADIALLKQDKAGLVSFSNRTETFLKAERGATQLKKILEQLYKEKEYFLESNYEALYQTVRTQIKSRSLLFIYSNFESRYSLERVLPALRKMNQLHLIVVVFFINTEIEAYVKTEASSMEEVYQQTLCRKYLSDKLMLVEILKTYGIQTILTKPEDLSINSINKYLELKAKGLI
ncbi:MAG TPA: DUF58 domain-containing protein [Cytophagaceae bacterium]|jgi:uncharacterized protein (DUF58 family)|nr:DUF58 domain-containing protein [Cytophagaceae bacterium]